MCETRKIDLTLVHHLIDNTLTDEERGLLLACIREGRSKAEFFSLFDSVWEESGERSYIPQDVKDDIYHDLMVRINPQVTPEVAPRRSFPLSSVVRYVAAACVITVLGIGCLWMYIHGETSRRQLSQRNFTVVADRGQKADVMLPDGTRVWLNSDSRLMYPADYGITERYVTLEGEANFKVAKNKECRFIVNAKEVLTEALGTEFNIRAYGESDYVSVSLYEGSVRVEYDDQVSLLRPNERLRILLPDGTCELTHDDDTPGPAWMRSEFTFDGESLAEIAVIMSRTFDTEVIITDKSLAEEQFVGTVSNTNITNFINIISLVSPIDYYFENDTLYLTRKPMR